MVVKGKAFSQERVFEVILSIQGNDLRVYAALLYWLACRSGELLPYAHYKSRYSKRKGEHGTRRLLKKRFSHITYGVDIDSVEVSEDLIRFKEVPVFKLRKGQNKEGFVFRKNNPLFTDIREWVLKRKALREELQDKGELNTVYLFSSGDFGVGEVNRFFWMFKKRLERALKLVDKSFSVHSLRVSRATVAGNASGDAFYVRDITGHSSVEMAGQYVKGKRLFENMRKYEVENK